MDLECPYCEKYLDICHDDGFGYEEGVKHQYECPHCSKKFVFETSISFYYDPSQADCLNGENHDWKKTSTFPSAFSKMCCTMCGEERDLTEEERKQYGIPTIEEYYKSLEKS